MKYFRQAYLDLLQEHKRKGDAEVFRRQVETYFDRLEVGFFTQWDKMAQGQLVTGDELCERMGRRSMETDVCLDDGRYRELFENMRSGVAVYEPNIDGTDFAIRDFNRAAERIEGCRRDSLLGKSIVEVFPGVKESGLLDVLQRVHRTGFPESFPVAIYRDERIFGWRENYVYRLPSGELVAIYDDVSERVQAQATGAAEQERLDAPCAPSATGSSPLTMMPPWCC